MEKEKIDFDTFSDSFLYCFCFKQISRPRISLFVKIHFKIYSSIYEKIYTVEEYAKNLVEQDKI